MDNKKVWFITGASKGIGLSLVKALLAQNYAVAATSRTIQFLKEQVGEKANFLSLEVNLVDEASVKDAINKTIDHFGGIDVVVNNAGYGQLGTIEELTDEETRKNFDVNVFGSLNVIRNVMPFMRMKKSGHIINISSIAGFTGEYSGVGIYCATKFAVAGFTEALSAEAKEFGISVTVVYPGVFRTNFLEQDSIGLPKNPIAEYTEGRKVESFHLNELNGNQQGNPEKAAVALIKITETANPPLHLFLGSDAFKQAQEKIEELKKALNDNESLSRSTDFQL